MSFFGFGGPSKPTPTPPRGPIGGGQAFPPPAAPSSKPGPFGPGGGGSTSSSSAPPPQERSRGNSGSAPSDSSSMFSSMNVVKSDVPVSTGFNFLQPAAPAPVAAAPVAAAASGFNFGGPPASGGAGASVAAPPAASGFAFGAAAAAPALPVAVAGGGGAGGGVAPLPIAGGEIKKKKPSFRPGFAREGGDAPPSTSFTANPASQGLEAPSSFLAGMQVHTPGEGEEEQHNQQQQQQAGFDGGGTLLSGLQVHSGGGGGGGGGSGGGGGGGGEGEEGGGGPSSLLSGLSVRPLEGGAQIAQAPSGGISAGGFSFMSSMPSSSDSSSSTTTPITAGGFSLPGFGGGAAAPLSSPADNASSSSSSSSISQLPSPTRPATTHAPNPTPAAPQQPPLDATAAMRGVIASLAEASRSARLRLADLKVRLRSVEVELVEAGVGVDRVKAEVRDLEVQQDESVRAERFEEAEVVAEKLKVVQGGALAAAEAKRGSLLALKASLLEEQEGAFEDCAGAAGAAVGGLGAYEGERSRALAGLRAEVHAGHSASAERMATEEEQLRLKEQHVDSESALVEQEERGIEATIAEQTEALTRSAGELRATHATLAREVRELEEALAGKRAAESAARGALGEAEGKISAIRAKFEKQSKRLGAKREAVEGEKRECAGEAAALGAAKGEFAALKRRDRARERGLLRQLGANALEKATAGALAGALTELGGVRSALALGAAAAAQRSAALEEEVERAVRAVRANAVRRAALEAQATHLTASIAAMDAREPVLGEEKKKAVGEKKFKEAGRLNDELKRLGELREKAVRELSDCTSGVDECEAESVGLEGGVSGAQGALEVEVRAGEGGRLEALSRAVATAARHALRVGRLYKPAPITPTVAWVDPVTLAPLGPGDMDDTPYDASPEDLSIEVPPAGVAQQAESAAAGSGPWLSTLQSAAVEILVAERDVFVEEAAAIAGRLGVPFSLGKILAEVAAEEKERGGSAEGDAAAAAAAASGSFEVAASTDAVAAAAAAAAAGGTGTAAAAAASSSLSEGGGDASNAPAFPLVPPTSADFTAVDSNPPLSFLSGGDSEGGGSSSISVAVGGFSFLGGGGGASASGTDGGALPFSSSSSSSFPSSSFPSSSEGGGMEGGEVPPTEESDTSPSAGGGGGGVGVDPMVELRELAQGIRSIAAAITEKEEAISNAVGKEDYETADAIQLDIDALNEQRAKTMARALEVHGAPVSDEDILAWCEGGDGGGAAAGGGGAADGVPEASGFSFVAQ